MNHTKLYSKKIQTISDYLQWIQYCYDYQGDSYRPLFFRGHANKDWLLLPAIFRDCKYKERDIILDYKQIFTEEWDYLSSIERILIRMQHHAIPTRLLDWSISPLVALFFACSNNDSTNTNAQIYALDPWKTYSFLKPSKIVPTYYQEIMKQARLYAALEWSFEEIFNYISKQYHYEITSKEIEQPLPIVGRYSDERVKTQQGCFTIWGKDKLALDFYSAYKPNLRSVIIEAKYKQTLLKSLSQLGITEFVIFPDKEGMSKTIRQYGSIFYTL